jgi:putative oxidoreductase
VSKLDPILLLTLLRITTGALVFPHGLTKLLKGPVAAIGSQVVARGFPEWFAYLVTLGELAGLLLAVGLYTRVAATAVALTMASIVLFTQRGSVTVLGTGKSTGLELALMFGVSAALFALVPRTRYALDALRRR